jgi:Zn-dependent M28 family amino/carboxypeptidase
MLIFSLIGLLSFVPSAQAHSGPPLPPHLGELVASDEIEDEALRSIVTAAQADHQAWNMLAELCDDIGARLAGSESLNRAVAWSVKQLESVGSDKTWTEDVLVPAWERGEEHASMLSPRAYEMSILGLGGTVAGEVEGDVVVLDSLDAVGPQVDGKIVLFDIPMGGSVPTVAEYGAAVKTRLFGPSRAAEHGAIAAMVRSVTTRSLDTPHTGATYYDEKFPKIPAVAVTTEDAQSMARLFERGVNVRVSIKTSGIQHPDAPSHNVIGEITGTSKSKEVVLIGAHLDSWDVGQGAHDDGSGVVEVIQAIRIIKELGLQPKRTIRAVLFTNEENGLRGGKAYAEAHPQKRKERHVAAIESDLGGGTPRYWTASGTEPDMAWLRRAAEPLGLAVEKGGGGADIKPLGEHGVLLIGFRPDDSHYFDIHHTRADTVDKVDPDDLAKATAAMAGIAWQLANVD